MKFLVLSDLNIRFTRLGNFKNNSRAIGAYYVTQEARALGIDSCNIDYFLDWPRELLIECILKFFDNDKDCVIGYSGSIDASGIDYYKELTQDLKKDLPQLQVMLGGFREPQGDNSWVDILLVGRCTNILLDYLQGKDISQYQIFDNPPGYRNPLGVISEPPVHVNCLSEDFWSSTELMTIETALGCKFNCSFCGYDYRGVRNPQLNTVDKLVESMQSAYDQGGITHFFLADDTINEVDAKLELLGEVTDQLTFTPDLMSFARLDIMGAKPHQIDLMNECNLHGLFFGIESMNPEITKSIRKGGKPEKNLETLRLLKEHMPQAFTYGNWIVGLTGDSEESIWNQVYQIVDEQLLTSAGSNALRIYSNLSNDEIKSEFDKDPAKHGYKILKQEAISWDTIGYESDNWQNDWINRHGAEHINRKVDTYFAENLISGFTAHEFYSIKALLPGLDVADYNNNLRSVNRVQHKMMHNYIKDKSNYILGR